MVWSRILSKSALIVGVILCLLLAAEPGFAQGTAVMSCETRPGRPPATPLEKQVASKLAPILTCQNAIDDRNACNRFVGRALELLFSNSDFKTGPNDYMLANDIANGLEQPGNAGWRKIGVASDQSALDEAQRLANQSKPVIAARFGRVDPQTGARRPGHVVLIIPGTQEQVTFSPGYNWGALKTPNTASLFLDNPKRMFIGCPLSAVWKAPSGDGQTTGLYTK